MAAHQGRRKAAALGEQWDRAVAAKRSLEEIGVSAEPLNCVEPMKAKTPAARLPTGDDRLYEVKLDGVGWPR